MPDKAYDKVVQFLEDIKTGISGDDQELTALYEMMHSHRKAFMNAVLVSKNMGPHQQIPEMPEEDKDRVVGVLRRLPKGGIIENDGKEVFVPEVWVRNLGMEHGDLVSAVPLGMLNRSSLFEFTVEERRDLGANSDRVGVIGSVMLHGGEWFIYSEEEESLISLNPKDVRSLGLGEGDLVEVAYPAGDFSSARVAWKFDPSDSFLEEVNTSGGRKKLTFNKQKIQDVGDPILVGKTVLVVGGDLYRETFRQNFERRGARFIWESGFQGGQGKSIESKVRSADVVVLVTEMMSHRLPDVEAMCRRHSKPYVYAPSKGSTGAIRACQSIFTRKAR